MSRIENRIQEWRAHLLDLTKRNPLIQCASGARGAVELVHPEPVGIWTRLVAEGAKLEFPWRVELVPRPDDLDGDADHKPKLEDVLKSPALDQDHLLTALEDRALDRRLRRLHLVAKSGLSEQGVNCLFLAYGVLNWTNVSEGKPETISSPLLLVPLQIHQEGAQRPWSVQLYEEEVLPNHSLLQYLAQRLKIELPGFDESTEIDDATNYLSAVKKAVVAQPGWDVVERAMLGIFSFQKLAMWTDLDQNSARISAHPLCRLIAGESSVDTNPTRQLPRLDELDARVDPQSLHSILDCDSSQLQAVIAAREGMSFVLDGPPGTGKSQTIANIISEFLAQNKTVLFVSEKSAALEVVKRRLDDKLLGDFCLDCHSHKANKKEVIHELGRVLELPIEKYRTQAPRLQELHTVRAKLNAYVEAVHHVIEPLGASPYQVHGFVAELAVVPRAKALIPDVLTRDEPWLNEVVELLRRLEGCESLVDSPHDHPWRECKILQFSLTTLDDTRDTLEEMVTDVDGLTEKYANVRQLGFGIDAPTVADIANVLDEIAEVETFPVISQAWLSSGATSATAARLLSLCDQWSRARLLDDKVAIFLPAAQVPPDLLERYTQNQQTTKQLVRSLPKETVRVELAQLEASCERLRHAVAAVGDLYDAVEELAAKLSITFENVPQIKSLPRLQGLAEEVSRTTLLKPGWFDGEVQGKLLQVAAEYQQLFGAGEGHLPFADHAYQVMTPDFAARLQQDPGLQQMSRLLATDTLRGLQERVEAVLQLLPRLRELIGQVRENATRLVRQFLGDQVESGLQSSRLKLGTAANLTQHALNLLSHQSFCRSWLLQKTRDQLMPATQSAVIELDQVEQLRNSLAGKFVPRAFEDAGNVFALSGPKLESLWKWFSVEYREFREHAQDFFVEPISWWPPSVLGPVRRLRTYHRRLRNVRECEERVGKVAAVPQRRKEAWESLARSLDGCQQIAGTLGLTSDLLDPDAEISLEQVRAAARGLMASQCELQQFVLDARHAGVFQAAQCDLNRLGAYALDELDDVVIAQQRQFSERLTLLQKATECLTPNGDIALTNLAERAVLLQRRQQNAMRRKELEREYSGDLVVDDGHVDWGLVAESIQIVRQMQQRFTRLPANLINAMCTPDGIDRALVGKLAKSLGERLADLQSSMEQLGSDLWLRTEDASTGYLRESTDNLALRLGETRQLLEKRTKAVGDVVSLLRDGADLPVDKVGAHLQALQWRNDADKIVAAESTLRLGMAADAVPWASVRANAEWLRRYCDKKQNQVPDYLIPYVSGESDRAHLQVVRTSLKAAYERVRVHVRPALARLFPLDRHVSDGVVIESATVCELANWLTNRINDVDRLEEWTTFRTVQEGMNKLRAGDFLEQVFRKEISATAAPEAFRLRFYLTWLDAVYGSLPELREFAVDDHEELIQRFRSLDTQSINGSPKRIRGKLLGNPTRPSTNLGADSSETGVLIREANKKRRNMSLRQLFKLIPSVLQRLKPCMMMSPLAVSTYLESQEIAFDLVIFDEASQVLPHDAIGAIYRGKQLIVAGDQKQLPPTTFFARMSLGDDNLDEDSSEDDGIGNMDDYESILDVCTSILPRKRLCWHYRSRREQLIAFSNEHYYDNDLVTFPSVYDGVGVPAIQHVYVADGRWVSGRTGGYNAAEAERVVQLICDHYERRPNESLGVISLNQKQLLWIVDALADARAKSPRIDRLIATAESSDEPLLIKNLENVQGDERDHVIISMAYAYDEKGGFNKRFGPINNKGGERRLNVAVTRARSSLQFVSSVRHFDIGNPLSKGAQTLQAYLEYAETGQLPGQAIRAATEVERDAVFEREVLRALEQRGYEVVSRVGCGQFRIDFGLRHPEEERFLLGVECDGDIYRATPVARDRERLRPKVLHELGWRVCRVWSADWIKDPERQLQRIDAAFAAALHDTDDRPFLDGGSSVSEEDDEEPQIVHSSPTLRPPSGSVDRIDSAAGAQYLVRLLSQMGGTDEDGLIRFVAKAMGYGRAGSNIRLCIQAWIASGISAGVLRQDDTNRIHVASVSNASSTSASQARAVMDNQARDTDGAIIESVDDIDLFVDRD